MDYQGIIIEESLENKDILKDVKIVKTKVEDVTFEHKSPWIKIWTMDTVEIPEGQVDQLADKVSKSLDSEHSWYADFKNDLFHYIVFKDKVFKVDRSKPEEYEAVKGYGVSIGIPDYQLDFSPDDNDWERSKPNDKLKKIIEQSSFKIEDGIYIYTKVSSYPQTSNHFLVTKDSDEITVVTTEDRLNELNLIEKNKDSYKLIALNVSIPFYSVGFLSTVSSAIAKEDMNILIVSTYSKDYILVKKDMIDKAREVLLNLGFKEG